jgi:excisionase family DNA binding protein
MEAIIPVGIPYSQLLEDVRAMLRHELQHTAPAAASGANDAPQGKELLSLPEAAELLGVTLQTVHEWKRLGRLKYHKLGSRTYLKRSEVLAALSPQERTQKKGR